MTAWLGSPKNCTLLVLKRSTSATVILKQEYGFDWKSPAQAVRLVGQKAAVPTERSLQMVRYMYQ
jgi:hypothetical protein